jgi:hypothetical protein
MTHTTFSLESETARETRTPVRLPDRRPAGLFPGWGPKF